MSKLYEKFLQLQSQPKPVIDATNTLGRVLIIDGLNAFIRCFAAVPTMNDDGEHVGGITGFLKSIGSTIRMIKPTRVVIVFDGVGGSQRRRSLYPNYKQNRKPRNRLNRTYDFQTAEEEATSMQKQSSILLNMLSHLPVMVMAPARVEADDVIAYLAHLVEKRDGKVVVMSTDKDFLQIVNENIIVWNPIKKKIFKINTIVDEYGIHPNNFALFRSLDGDKSDNISGVRGIGVKTAIKMFPQLTQSKKFTIDELVAHAAKQKTGKLFETVASSKDLIELNYSLMELEKGQMSSSTRLSVLHKFDEEINVFDRFKLRNILVTNNMTNTIANFDAWLLSSFAPLTKFSSKE